MPEPVTPDLLIRPLQQSDHAAWRELWTAYLAFYETEVPEEVYETTWARLFDANEYEPNGFLALIGDKPVGLVHYIFHRTCWTVANNCYLQDLFTAPAARGSGVGAALIDAVRQAAEQRGVTNVYWMTQETNATARRLYDRVANNTGFIKYKL
jgi:GNAT superfamily N-acetyltransferase